MNHEIDIVIDEKYIQEVDSSNLKQLLNKLLQEVGPSNSSHLTLTITGDEILQELNKTHRGLDYPTDVLSYPYVVDDGLIFPQNELGENNYLGDIVISYPAALRNTLTGDTDIAREIEHLVVHGGLHLLGYDHDSLVSEKSMTEQEVLLLGEWVRDIWND
tara:strand:+ start:13107 stop:13586 length:480 start_codon:yes stop_codon:yes gene_type:complete